MSSAGNKPLPAKRCPRVLMLLENSAYSEDGRVRCEANSLASAGYTVTVICPRVPGERLCETFGDVVAYQFPAAPRANGLLGYLIEYSYAMTIISLLTVWAAFRRGFDMIHAHNPPDFFVVIAVCWKVVGKRFIFDQHDLSPDMYMSRFSEPGNPLLHRILLFFERLSCRRADHVIVTNESCKRIQMERSGIPASRITVVRNGPEPWHLDRYEPDPTLRVDKELLIGYVGMMGKQDGIDYLLRALRILDRDFGRTNWRCILLGKGDAFDELKKTAVKLGIADKVNFAGWVLYEKVPQYLSAMDICAVPDPSNIYNDHSTIVKVMEYMAQAKPMVAFDLPEHRVTAGNTALYAQANDETDFARQIARLMDDDELRQRMGEAGRQRVIENFTWKCQEANLFNAYRCLQFGAAAEPQDVGDHRSLVPVKS